MIKFWISHPRNESSKGDTMLTLSVYAFVGVVFKFITNGVSFSIGDFSIDFGTVDAALIGALLTPTLGAYVIRKYKDSPDNKIKENEQ